MLDIISRSFVISVTNPGTDGRLNIKINEHLLIEFLDLRTAMTADIKKAEGQLKFPHSVKYTNDSIDSNNPLKWELNDRELTLKPFNGRLDCKWTVDVRELIDMAYREVFPTCVGKNATIVSERLGQLQRPTHRHLGGIHVNEEVWYGDDKYISVTDGTDFAIRFKADGKKWAQCSSYLSPRMLDNINSWVEVTKLNQGYPKVKLADYVRPLIEQFASVHELKKHLQSN